MTSVIELIKEQKGSVEIESIMSDLPKGQQKKKAAQLIAEIHNEFQTSLVQQKLTETKLKKLNDKIKQTDAFKAVKQMKAEIKKSKKDTEKLALMLLGMKKMAKALDIDLPNVKALLED